MGGSPEKEASLESTCTPPTRPVCPTTAGPQSWEQPGCHQQKDPTPTIQLAFSMALLGWVAPWKLTSDKTPPPKGIAVMVKVGGKAQTPAVHVMPGDYLVHHHFSPSLCRWEVQALEREGSPAGS